MIKYLEYENVNIPVRIQYSALKKLSAEQQKGKPKTGSKNTMELANIMQGDITLYESLLFYSMQSGYKKTGEKMPYTRDDMEDILDECMMDFIAMIPEFFPDKTNKTEKGDGGAELKKL